MKIDTLITGARIVDGAGNPWFYGDVALVGDQIAAIAPVGRLNRAEAGTVVDAAGKVVCPGFIDIQSHSLMPLYKDGRGISKVTQGVTTEILGELWTPDDIKAFGHRFLAHRMMITPEPRSRGLSAATPSPTF